MRDKWPCQAVVQIRRKSPLLTLVAACIPSVMVGSACAAPVPPRPGMVLAFDDEFDGTSVDPNRWTTLHPEGYRRMPGNDEDQVYVDAAFLKAHDLPAGLLPFHVADGRLTITATALTEDQSRLAGGPFTSGMLTTAGHFEFTYGYVEVKASLPSGDGLWPAIWLMHRGDRTYSEIDVMEMLGHEPARIYETVHHGPDWTRRKIDQAEYVMPSAGGEHVFALDWTPESLTFFVDGIRTAEFPTSGFSQSPMYMIVNLAVGGKWSKPPDQSVFPAKMTVGFVRVWQRR